MATLFGSADLTMIDSASSSAAGHRCINFLVLCLSEYYLIKFDSVNVSIPEYLATTF
jgi:hypothetical protein